MEHLLHTAATYKLTWPANANEFVEFGNNIVGFAAKVRTAVEHADQRTYAWKGGDTKKHDYLVKHFARSVLFAAMEIGDGSTWLDSIPLHTILAFTPDQLDHVLPFKHMVGRHIREVFGVSPLLFSCWSCLVNTMFKNLPEGVTRKHVMSVPDIELWRAVTEYEKELCTPSESDPPWPPGPLAIMRAALRK